MTCVGGGWLVGSSGESDSDSNEMRWLDAGWLLAVLACPDFSGPGRHSHYAHSPRCRLIKFS